MFRPLVILALATAFTGCLEGGSVALTFTNSTAMPSVGAGLSADAASAKDVGGDLVLTAGDASTTLTLTLTGPFTKGATPTFGQAHNSMSLDVGAAGWSSDSGSVTFTVISPNYQVVFNDVRMLPGSGSAQGEFTVRGKGTFVR